MVTLDVGNWTTGSSLREVTAASSGVMGPVTTWYVAPMCPRCKGGHYLQECPQVKAIEYQEDGRTVKRVEFFEKAVAGEPKISVSGAIRTCPQCEGKGQQPWFLPLATEPYTWQTCDACHGSGFVVATVPTTAASAADITVWTAEGNDVRLG